MKPYLMPLLNILILVNVRGQGRIESILPDWIPVDRQKLAIASASASATLSDQYAPARIHDGDRKTKWVCPIRPSPSAPAWITLSLADGAAEVSAVAVFGERIGNDGILDADVQVQVNGAFKTMASLRNANSPSWVATFAPVRTSQVRLLVLRSSGPTDHTDVWEMMVCGRTLNDAELAELLRTRLHTLQKANELAVGLLSKFGPTETNQPLVFRSALHAIQTELAILRQTQEKWPTLDHASKCESVRQAESAASLADRLVERTRHATETNQGRRAYFESLRRELLTTAASTGATARTGPDSAIMSGGGVTVRMDLEHSNWSAVWSEGIEAGIAQAAFSVQVNGIDIAANKPRVIARKVASPGGAESELACVWESQGIRVERELRLDPRRGVVLLSGRIKNQAGQEVKLGTTKLLHVDPNGGWWAGGLWTAPAAIYIQGHSLLRSSPLDAPGNLEAPMTRSYHSSGLLALAGQEPTAVLLIGYLRADEAAPEVNATFRLDEGGAGLSADSRFLNRVLGANETLELNRLYLAADRDPFHALEAYGNAMATSSSRPARTGATSLWCSWYAHRMAMTEQKVLANAEVAARHFKPLGFEIMQLDHGWQRGDITGDWTPNERFPHGLQWLANELKQRYGLRLGVWIAPTDVADTSELYRQHRDWMLRGSDGAPRVNWRWYWLPNPNCYELDATHPDTFNFLVDTFRQLTAAGVSYYKIDFIAAAGGEQFYQHDPKATRGWSNLRRAMEAIRLGAGEDAWIRYCQTPPILSTGLANSAYGGDDTLDAGIPGRFDVLRDNAHALAAGYWLNDRAYHREVCDMSVRMQAGLEEVRVRAAMMTLANCSISWSDELCYLPPSRIHLMQQCLPPGNPPMRPLDLFKRDVPSIWHIMVTNQVERWDVVGLFNFNAKPEIRSVRFEQLGLDPASKYAVFEFWEERFLELCHAGVELNLPPESSRILSIRRITGVPQLIGTDMHLLQGYHEVKQFAWDVDQSILTATYRRAPGLSGKVFILIPDGYAPKFDFPLSPASARLTHLEGSLWMQEIEFTETDYSSSIPFTAPKKVEAKEPSGA